MLKELYLLWLRLAARAGAALHQRSGHITAAAAAR